ncbi:ABC transporter permease [Salipiger aestuarii]|uniref:NitT/TauT family transport system permease protein n=1 Tax=Salipiger aestuarii TaxID=568098 RepID=A0A327Y2P9_9RHOB|nr:ABC transporter permease [Salipiger aestuarii]EIE49774.1 binding-protein-dependent transport systems inner membrane component [Citreicella sp. 357]KAA8611138.1 ABC transporter permease [Salipiger aestuarii]KAB2541905.1 ABC transporter permease [Salipiger aestuarii]RAK15370.1 NitT/TauT family transport system permease protein [Salipiger aestuarii]
MKNILPVLTVILALLVVWYASAFQLNKQWALDMAARQDRTMTTPQLIADTWAQDKPKLPAPHQIVVELWNTVALKKVTSKRSLVYHAWVTLSATLAGFGLGTVLGISLAVGIVYSRVMDRSVMPWVIASQTIPILAIAPMIIVVLNAVGVSGLLPKALISMYLSFFPIVVGMVKGLRSPSRMELDQMRTWNASGAQEFARLRLPASMPYLFASLKIAMAASLVGAIVGELPTGAVAGLGARLLAGSYYGQTIQIWSALFMAAAVAAAAVGLIGLIQRATLKRMGLDR